MSDLSPSANPPFPFNLKERTHIPAVMGTEHPDNASQARFLHTPSAKIMVNDEIEEFHYMFKKLGLDEVMLDAEGKAAEATPLMKLIPLDMGYYKKKVVGKDIFITFRVPNPEHKKDYRLPNAFQTILTSTRFIEGEFKLKHPPLLEAILPMTVDGHQPFRVLKRFHQTAQSEHKIWNDTHNHDFISVIPLVEEPKYMLKFKQLLYDYVSDIKNNFGFVPQYLRTMIARSDPAMMGGLISATLGAKVAISENYLFERETGIKIYPIIGVGTLLARGLYSPDTVDEFFKTYPGVKTVTVQSAFRYDYDEKSVRKAVSRTKQKIRS
ncbi:MAG: phosphoenolpyruvate carboxylase, partial [Nanoarchaeota archaeon]